jgi:1-acyl-sn-glycerol-3-phosphate acyltransferase
MTLIPLPFFCSTNPVNLAQTLLSFCQTRVWVQGREHLPQGSAIIISNHRSFLDAPVLIAALSRPVHFACHYYLSQVPGLREIALGLGCIPLQQGSRQQIHFFREAELSLRQQEMIGLFPEGAQQIARPTLAHEIGAFQPGFAYLALRSQVDPLPIVPVAIRVHQEWQAPDIPMEMFRLFDTTEPMFQRQGGHPVVLYRDVELMILPPIWIGSSERQLVGQERISHIQSLIDHTQGLLQQQLV